MTQESAGLSPVFGIDEALLTAKVAVAAYHQIDDRIFPASVISRLPLAREGVARWRRSNDLYALIADLFSVRTIVVTEEGEREAAFTAQTAPRFSEAQTTAKKLVKRFARGPEAPTPRVLGQDPTLGAALKSIAAWDVVAEALLTESATPSLPHLLESSSDLQASAQLAADCFYKQASQVLRGFLEGQVVALLLADDTAGFRLWKNGGRFEVRLRGDNGFLRRLQSRGKIEASLGARISTLYGELNHEVHGGEATFIHSGVFAGAHVDHTFRPDRLSQWCNRVVEAVEVCLYVVRTAVQTWQSSLRDSTVCHVCREGPLVHCDTFGLGGRVYGRRRCSTCTTEDTVERDSGHRVWVVSRGA